MADGVPITAGSGTTIATDDDGTAHHQYVKLEYGPDNTQTKVSATNPLPVSPTANGVEVAKAEDAPHTSGDYGYACLVVRRDSPSAGAADGDYCMMSVDANGLLRTTLGTALPAGTNNIGDVDVLTLPGVAGTAAHDAAVSGNPVRVGARARTSDLTAVANDDAVDLLASVLGKIVVLPGALLANQVQGNLQRTDNTGGDVIAAQGSGVKIAVMSITVVNQHATVDTEVTLRSATTAKIGPLMAKAAGGGFTLSGGGYPLFVTGANEAVTAICGTTGSNVRFTVSGYTTTE